MKQAQPWFIVAALRGIGRHVKNTTQSFTVGDVVGWDEDLKDAAPKVRLAMDRLVFHKMAAAVAQTRDGLLRPVMPLERRWTLTAKGLGTCQSVLREQHGTKGPDAKALSTRLWSLLRLRKVLTPEEGAETLIDAGSRDFSAAQKQIAGYLRAWSKLVPDSVQVGARATKGGKRYVMVKDGGATPPPTKATAVPFMTAPKAIAKPQSSKEVA